MTTELGSLEGYVERVENDVLHIRLRLTGQSVKCLVEDEARDKVAMLRSGQRVRVTGVIRFEGASHVRVTDVMSFRSSDDLPSVAEIEDVTFTGGIRSEEYLEKLRNGGSFPG